MGAHQQDREWGIRSGEVTCGRGPLPFQNEHCDSATIEAILEAQTQAISRLRLLEEVEAMIVYIISCDERREKI